MNRNSKTFNNNVIIRLIIILFVGRRILNTFAVTILPNQYHKVLSCLNHFLIINNRKNEISELQLF